MGYFLGALAVVLAVCLIVAVLGTVIAGPHSPIADVDADDIAWDSHGVASAWDGLRSAADSRRTEDTARARMVA
ncbi:MAG: hypothetical protein AB7U62_04060 [Pseudolabrys sp.]